MRTCHRLRCAARAGGVGLNKPLARRDSTPLLVLFNISQPLFGNLTTTDCCSKEAQGKGPSIRFRRTFRTWLQIPFPRATEVMASNTVVPRAPEARCVKDC